MTLGGYNLSVVVALVIGVIASSIWGKEGFAAVMLLYAAFCLGAYMVSRHKSGKN